MFNRFFSSASNSSFPANSSYDSIKLSFSSTFWRELLDSSILASTIFSTVSSKPLRTPNSLVNPCTALLRNVPNTPSPDSTDNINPSHAEFNIVTSPVRLSS